jgi:hypothetical protein
MKYVDEILMYTSWNIEMKQTNDVCSRDDSDIHILYIHTYIHTYAFNDNMKADHLSKRS